MIVAGKVTVRAGGMVSYPPLYAVSAYMERSMLCIDARRFAMKRMGGTLTVRIGSTDGGIANVGWQRRWSC